MTPARARRSYVLLAVLVVMTSAILVVTGLLFVTQAEAAGLAAARDGAQRRALGWSGLQAVMSRLEDQRREILEGRTPQLEESYTIYEAPGRLGVVRLRPVTPDGALLAPEAGRLDLNHVDADALEATGLVERPLAEAIIARRRGSWSSVAALLDVPGVTPSLLYGSLEDLLLDEAETLPADLAEPRGLADVVTVYAQEPQVQRDGAQRMLLNVPWSEELGRRLERRFGAEAAAAVREMLEGGRAFEDEGQLVRALAGSDVPPEQWGDLLDAFTPAADPYRFGRLDLNTAPYEALLGLEGLEPELAAQIADAREGLADDRRATIAWPVVEGILDGGQLASIAGSVTTRSWTYRVRLEAGEVDEEDPDGPLRGAVLLEAVVDLVDPTPRIAYLRDVTHWLTAAGLLASAWEPTGEEQATPPETEQTVNKPVASAPSPPRRSARPAPNRRSSPTVPADSAPNAGGTDGSSGSGRRMGRWRAG